MIDTIMFTTETIGARFFPLPLLPCRISVSFARACTTCPHLYYTMAQIDSLTRYTQLLLQKKKSFVFTSILPRYIHPPIYFKFITLCSQPFLSREKDAQNALIVMHHKIKKHTHMEKQIKQSRFFYSKIKQSRLCYQTRRSGSDLRQAHIEGWPRPAGVSPGPFRLPRCAHLPICAHEGMWM